MKSEKPLPCNIDCERFLLGSIMIDDSKFFEVTAAIAADDFVLQKHRIIFRRMIELQERGEHIDRITIANELMKFSELETCDGLTYLVSLDDGLPQVPDLTSYIRIVKDMADKRRMIFTLENARNRVMENQEPFSELLNSTRDALFNITTGTEKGAPQRPGDIIQDMGGISVFLGPPERGIQTGFVKYDEMTGGLHGGEVTIIAARPSVGKTALALNIAHNVAVKQGKKVAVFSLEMSKRMLLHRMVCSSARVDSQRVRAGYLSREERGRVADATSRLADSQLYLDDQASLTNSQMYAKVRRLHQEHGLDLVITDYLQLMTAPGYENRNQEVSAISRGIKMVAMELNLPMLILSQLNRSTETRKGGGNRPQLSDLRESGSIEQDADNVAFIFREEMYSRDREDLRGLAELIIGKQRNGPVGTVNLVYIHQQTKFENRAEDTGEDQSAPLPFEGEQ